MLFPSDGKTRLFVMYRRGMAKFCMIGSLNHFSVFFFSLQLEFIWKIVKVTDRIEKLNRKYAFMALFTMLHTTIYIVMLLLLWLVMSTGCCIFTFMGHHSNVSQNNPKVRHSTLLHSCWLTCPSVRLSIFSVHNLKCNDALCNNNNDNNNIIILHQIVVIIIITIATTTRTTWKLVACYNDYFSFDTLLLEVFHVVFLFRCEPHLMKKQEICFLVET